MAREWIRSDEVVWEALDGETVLIQPRQGRTWLLNAAAAFVWRYCNGQTSSTEIARYLSHAGRHQTARVAEDVRAFCAELEALGLLSTARPTAALVTVEMSFSGPYSPPRIRPRGFGVGPRHRPSPRGLSGPG
jgi:hypothetical protein